jgi:hypothetical protein
LKKLIKIFFFLFVNYNIHATSGSGTNKYNLQHPASFPSVYILDKETRNVMLLLVQEIKRDIIYRRMNLPQSAQQVTHPQRLIAHLDSSIHRLHSYLQYIGTVKYCKHMEALQRLCEINLEWLNFVNLYHAFTPTLPWQFLPIPCQHCTNRPHSADLATSPNTHVSTPHVQSYNIMNIEVLHIPSKNHSTGVQTPPLFWKGIGGSRNWMYHLCLVQH